MLFYENESCPVCNELFKDGDDIVTCPECGTPHHRHCYEQLGKCANAEKHSQGFEYQVSQPKTEEKEEKQTFNPFENATGSTTKTKCEKCGAEIEKGVPFCNVCGTKQSNANFSGFAQPFVPFSNFKNEYSNSNEKFDDESLEDISTVIGKNSRNFIKFFKKGTKTSWNWGAFIFGAYYFFYRKMHKAGVIIFALTYAIVGLSVYLMNDIYQLIISYADKFYQSNGVMPNISNADNQAINKFCIILLGAMLVLRVVCAIFANKIYEKKVIGIIKSTKEKINSGEELNITAMFANSDDNANVGKDYLYKMQIASKGGTTIFAPLFVYFALMVISRILTGSF